MDENKQGTDTTNSGGESRSTHNGNTGNPVSADVQTWIDKYNGAQGFGAAQKQRADELEKKLQATIADYEAKLVSLVAERDTHQTTAQQHAQRLSEIEANYKLALRQIEVGRTIRQKFPDLADLYDEGLMIGVESLEGDALNEYLQKFAGKLGARQQADLERALEGATPQQTAGNDRGTATTTLNDLRRDLQKAYTEHGPNSKQYQDAYNAYHEAVMKGIK